MRKLICIAPEGHLQCDEQVASYVSANWAITMVRSVEEALALTNLSDHLVAVYMFGQDNSTWISEAELDALDGAHLGLVALLTPETMQQGRVREFIATRFQDYHTLPVDPARLLATLGHVHGMAALRSHSSLMPTAHSQREQKHVGRLIAYIQSLREAERSRIARDVHDELGQSLTVIKLKLLSMSSDRSLATPRAKAELDSLTSMIDGVIGTTQRIATELRPAILDSLGLVAACEWLVDRYRLRTGLDCKCTCVDLGVKIDEERRTALFRILQEALTNVVRHAEATQIKVSLSRQGQDLVLEVSDNGKGLNPDSERECPPLGLLGIRERATMLGGKASIESPPRAGTRVVVSIPLTTSNATQNDGRGTQGAASNGTRSDADDRRAIVSVL